MQRALLLLLMAFIGLKAQQQPLLLQTTETVRKNACTQRTSDDCNFCIELPDCGWCADPKFKGPRCDTRAWLSEGLNCGGFLQDPQNSVQILEDEPLTSNADHEGGNSGQFVQITPQRVKLKLRPGISTTLTFKVAHAREFPVDLYYLMDLSNSMSDDKDTIVRMGQELVYAIQNITRDFQIGFGSFVDKEVMPFISLVPQDNCQLDTGCPQPYSFQHQMSLSPDAKQFQQRVADAPISGNIDNPEGGFDALLQVMVCEKMVGWRPESRRVIVFTTDQSFHIALDGKLGGLVTPNDGQCHLNRTGFYTYSTVQDYPSIGHINQLAKNKAVNIIWAVTESKFGLYKGLSEIVAGSRAGKLTKDSSNIVELVKQQYQAITTNINVTWTNTKHCDVSIKPKCGPKSTGCHDVELGTEVEFEMRVTLNKCLPETFQVYPVGINERMTVEIEPICNCECSSEDINICGSPECQGKGTLVCGTCQCCGDAWGLNCECANGTPEDQDDPLAKCRPIIKVGNTTRVGSVCMGHGECQCGQCICEQRPEGNYTGEFCGTACPTCIRDAYGRICSDHGTCDCGNCICDPGWEGSDCGCKIDNLNCLSNPEDNPDLICNGNGNCQCGQCVCDDFFGGEFCGICETCQTQCAQLRPCVECLAFGSPDLLLNPKDQDEHKQEIIANCSQFCPFYYQELIFNESFQTWHNCTFLFGVCSYTFSHSDFIKDFGPQHVILHLNPDEDLPLEERKQNCPKPADFLGIILGVIGAIVGVGLITIFMWKALTTIHDRKEFARFEQERMNMKFSANSNPIFKQATTTIQNPIFNPHDH